MHAFDFQIFDLVTCPDAILTFYTHHEKGYSAAKEVFTSKIEVQGN